MQTSGQSKSTSDVALRDIQSVQRGDVVRFNSYSLRVDDEPLRQSNSITLKGRISIDGCPIVTKRFIGPRMVIVERR